MSGQYIPAYLRKRISRQAGGRCGYCLTAEEIVGTPMEIDHLLPRAMGGKSEESNLWLACALCNARKSDRVAALDPVSGELVPLFNPRRQAWTDHFAWIADGSHIQGRTASGRATVIALDLNRSSLVIARQR